MSGIDFTGQPSGWGEKILQKYTAEDYHKPSDQIKPYFTPDGAILDLKFVTEVGYRIANAKEAPTWNVGSEFQRKQNSLSPEQRNESITLLQSD